MIFIPAKRHVFKLTLLTAASLAALSVFVRIEQYMYRLRVELLHGEILAFQLHPGNFSDIQRIQREWGAHGHYDGACTQRHCIYEVTLYDGLDDWFRDPSGRAPYFEAIQTPLILKAYALFGGRPAYTVANLRIRDDRMWGADFSLGIMTYPGVGRNNGHPYVVIGGIQSGSRLSHLDGMSLRDFRRGFGIESELNCLGCEFVDVFVTPLTDAHEIERFNQFEFRCITAFLACKHPADIAPEAWIQSTKDKADPSPSNQQWCEMPAAILAREIDDIVLARVVLLKNDSGSKTDSGYQEVTVQVLEALKNGKDFRVSNEALFVPKMRALHSESADDPGKLTPKQDYYFFFSYRRPSPDSPYNGTYLEACHVLAKTPANAAAIREGIALDPSNGEPYDFRGTPHLELGP